MKKQIVLRHKYVRNKKFPNTQRNLKKKNTFYTV